MPVRIQGNLLIRFVPRILEIVTGSVAKMSNEYCKIDGHRGDGDCAAGQLITRCHNQRANDDSSH